jgi:murein DD-endopeptidase MepM/ murein hydrolase activator NlpD
VGDRVSAGDQLGLLGNSGASGAPHLHFHVMSGPSSSGSDGFPYVLDAFELAGTADPDALLGAIQGEAVFPPRTDLDPVAHAREMPLSYDVVDFPPR